MTTDAVIAAVRDDLYAAEYQEWSAMLESSLPPRESQEPDPTCCTACGLTIFGVDRECGLCAECRHDLAEAAAWLAMTEAADQHARQRAESQQMSEPYPDDGIPY